jgi:hypothetical protein
VARVEERIGDKNEMEGPKIWGGDRALPLTPTNQSMDFWRENHFSYEKKAN